MKVWKHHIAEHFEEDPSLCQNNGAGEGSTVFTDFDAMKDHLSHTGRRWYVAELEVEEDEIARIDANMATMLVYKESETGFKPLEEFSCGCSSVG